MALVDVLIGVVIGFVGGVVVPAAVLYRYRHRIGQWVVERQARQAFEEGFDDVMTEGAFSTEGTVIGSEDDTGRCDCGELVSPELDEECPNCGAPVLTEEESNHPDGGGIPS